ncbi:MAG: hypothetical protein DDT23_00009 [candidate division WS2 bacterium]|nr:hypothetical protein [Candidatus Lithacetigena glycinireducens]
MTNIERVRLLIGDITTPPYYSDIRISEFLSIADNSLFLASALALQAWAGALSDSMDSEKIGDYSFSKKQVENKLALAELYLKKESETPAVAWASFNLTGE